MFVVALPFPMLGSHFLPTKDTMFWPGREVRVKEPVGQKKKKPGPSGDVLI